MKKSLLMTMAMLLLAAPMAIGAQAAKTGAKKEIKIGYVDLQRALNESNEGKAAKVELQAAVKDMQADIDKKVAERDKLKAELDKQASVLSPKAKKEKEAQLEKLGSEAQDLITKSNTEMQQKQREKEIVILKKIKDAIEQIGKSGNYLVILPSDVILYSDGAKELTDEVIKDVNETAATPAGK